jgi:hypothetical protein
MSRGLSVKHRIGHRQLGETGVPERMKSGRSYPCLPRIMLRGFWKNSEHGDAPVNMHTPVHCTCELHAGWLFFMITTTSTTSYEGRLQSSWASTELDLQF